MIYNAATFTVYSKNMQKQPETKILSQYAWKL